MPSWEAREARREGLAKGREEGLETGLEKGREEERKKLIKSLHDNGMAIETIVASVGLAKSAIRRLLNDKNGL